MARIRRATNYTVEKLDVGWQLTELQHGKEALPASPVELDATARDWTPALCPGTVASALRALGAWDFSSNRNFDGSDWWYRVAFSSKPCASDESLWLEFDGLATIADVWLNGAHVLRSENMFCEHELDVSRLIATENELRVRFSSLDSASSARRPRPRFKTKLIERQQLRWFRTTLLGRIPGWTPRVSAVGPWREARLVRRRSFSVTRVELRSRVEDGRALVSACLRLAAPAGEVESATLHVGPWCIVFSGGPAGSLELRAELEVPDAERWWPHSHGQQPRYPARIAVVTSSGVSHELRLDPVAFRSIRLDTADGRFALIVNDVEIRCRGACWTTADVVSLNNTPATLSTLRQVRDAGMNMLRVGGTMVYESDAFYEECDRVGILVWQDFMFANCDYPVEDAAFQSNVSREAAEFLSRTETRASLSVLCGSSEVEQQTAMLGLPRETWKSPLFQALLCGLAQGRRPDLPYVTSSPSGGALPFQANIGVTHYYGVGAYLRPLEDARRAEVKFAAECLGFANIPEESTLATVLGDGDAPFHHPRWKARSPRDSGAGWDFDDVRDHYTKLLFNLDPNALRYEDPERALALGRVTSGEVMARTLGEWRRPTSTCRGALIWFLRDLWPGAGWGLIDSQGVPKAAFYYVKRAMQARAVFLSDEGLNGLVLHALNDSEQPLLARLELQLIRDGSVRIATGNVEFAIEARGSFELECSTLFEHFIDLTHAYRFGPRQYDVALAALRDSSDGSLISEACYFPGGLPSERSHDLGLAASFTPVSGDDWQLRIFSKRFAHAVALDVPGFEVADSYFNVSPDSERTVSLRAKLSGAVPKGFVQALNAQGRTKISITPQTS